MTDYSLFSGVTPAGNFTDTVRNVLGFRFKSSVDGYITALRVYNATGTLEAIQCGLFALDGTLLGSANTPTGGFTWLQADLITPVAITHDVYYCACYLAKSTLDFAFTTGVFNSGDIVNGPLTCTSDSGASSDAGGWYTASTTLVLPTTDQLVNYAWYANDIIFSTTLSAPPGTELTGTGSMSIPDTTAFLKCVATGSISDYQSNGKQVPLFSKMGLLWAGKGTQYFTGHQVQQEKQIIEIPLGCNVLAWDITSGVSVFVETVDTL